MSEWIEWTGGNRPIDSRAVVDIRFADGTEELRSVAGIWHWTHEFDVDNIIAYRIVEESK